MWKSGFFRIKMFYPDFHWWNFKPLFTLLMQESWQTNCRKLHGNSKFRSWEIWVFSWVVHFFIIFFQLNRLTGILTLIFFRVSLSFYPVVFWGARLGLRPVEDETSRYVLVELFWQVSYLWFKNKDVPLTENTACSFQVECVHWLAFWREYIVQKSVVPHAIY